MKSKRHIYLNMKTLEAAQSIVSRIAARHLPLSTETAAVPDSVGRTLAEPVFARLSSPAFHSAAMDGIAVNAEDTYGAAEYDPKILTEGENAFYVNTGNMLPENTNAVIMIEHVNISEDGRITVEAPAYPWRHVRKVGEDIVATELLFPTNHVVTPYCIGALLSGGLFKVNVQRKPKILIIPTGSELADVSDTDIETMQPGRIIESNSHVLGNLVNACGGEYRRHPIVSDDFETIKNAVDQAVHGEYDIVLVLGGSSAGSEDYSGDVIRELGEIHVHGVTMMPGKPVVIGVVKNKPVFGVPGYPVSAIMVFEQFIGPLICKLLGKPYGERNVIDVLPTRKIPSKLGLEEFVRVKIGVVGDKTVATPLPRAAGCITSITEADGIIRIPNHIEGLNSSEPVSAELLRPESSIRETVVVVGSHDNSLDILADRLKKTDNRFSLSSSHVGSMGGLMAVKRGMCHMAGTHLLDAEDGSYNISYIERYLPDVEVRLVHLVRRDQGLIVAKGNPKNVSGVEDLTRKEIRYINRQGGSGTRILLDYRLQQLKIDSSMISGYENEEFTHMAIAAAVSSGAADAGLGVHAAARALNLDFIPVVTEQYDIVIPACFFESDSIQTLLQVIRSPEFIKQVESLGGYGTERTGEILL